MKVLVVSGFLGAGKTTFIKNLINKTKKDFVILENEYGQNNLDSKDIKANTKADLQLLEFMEGCVCCNQKDTFANTILSISAGIDPEYLIVEPTGVGKLSNILKTIKQFSYEKIKLLDSIVIIAPQNYDNNMETFPDIFLDQIVNAKYIFFSKCENIDSNIIEDTVDKIKKVNPNANIIYNHYSSLDADYFNNLLICEGEVEVKEVNTDAESKFQSININNGYLKSIGELVLFLEDILHYEFGNIPRAKGTIKVGNEHLRFDVADRLYGIIKSNDTKTECVFIGNNMDENHIKKRLNSYNDFFDMLKKSRNKK